MSGRMDHVTLEPHHVHLYQLDKINKGPRGHGLEVEMDESLHINSLQINPSSNCLFIRYERL